mmetsp:Transcript_13707/g.15253  ORF Transcript_13707/g.15253 Transcript_13707/m.15253 type:complete len:693 (+) Transcript_13707:100-2178(+)
MTSPGQINNDAFGSSDLPPDLSEMFINSTDTLRKREINQKIPETWNDRPPLFDVITSKRQSFLWRQPKEDTVTEQEDPNLLKGMIRKGIPPSLRCAVWLSNIIQSCHSDQDFLESHIYRTLSKVQVVDGLYDSLWEHDDKNNDDEPSAASPAVVRISRRDVRRIDFGNDTIWTKLDEENCPGEDAVKFVLYALHHSVLGGIVDYAPLLPTLVSILLGFMSESYVFYACREMYHHSAWFFAGSRSEHIATQHAFSNVLGRLHPHTLDTMKEQDVITQYTKEIFQNFCINILPEGKVLRLMDIYSLEGNKVLFRFGVALAVLYGKEYKDHFMYASTEPKKWWLGLFDYCHGGGGGHGLNFEVLVKKAYGVHGRGVRKRFRFPRRPILARIIEIEEEKYRKENLQRIAQSNDEENADDVGADETDFYLDRIEPLHLVIPPQPTDPNRERVVPRLASSTFVRTKIAEWLPLSLRFTKLDLVYSTSYHGRTLENLYRCVAKSRHTILILEPFEDRGNRDTSRYLVGMYTSENWHPSRRVYGDGRSFLFRIDIDDEKEENKYSDNNNDVREEMECKENLGSKGWKWHPRDLLDFGPSTSFDDENDSQSNSIFSTMQTATAKTALVETFQVSTNEFMSLGGNEHGGAGLRLNEDLTKGESNCADGFDNEPLLPSASGLFEVGLVEVYQLVRQMDGVPVR